MDKLYWYNITCGALLLQPRCLNAPRPDSGTSPFDQCQKEKNRPKNKDVVFFFPPLTKRHREPIHGLMTVYGGINPMIPETAIFCWVTVFCNEQEFGCLYPCHVFQPGKSGVIVSLLIFAFQRGCSCLNTWFTLGSRCHRASVLHK